MKNKKVLITGVSSGIGFHLSDHFAKRGYRVFAISRQKNSNTDSLQNHPNLELSLLDVVIDSEKVCDLIKNQDIDILINNAGQLDLIEFANHPEPRFREIFEVNFWSPLKFIREVLALSSSDSPKKVINISSMTQWTSAPFLSSYIASKRALEGACEGLKWESESKNCQLCMIEPGFLKTNIYRDMEAWINQPNVDQRSDFAFFKSKFKTIPVVPDQQLCQIIENTIAMDEMPFRLPVGAFSLRQIGEKLETWNQEKNLWQKLNASLN